MPTEIATPKPPAPTGWIPHFPLRPSAWTAPTPGENSLPVFTTLGATGEISLRGDEAVWSVHLLLSEAFQEASVSLRANGFEIHGKQAQPIVLQIPAAGILVGSTPLDVQPELFVSLGDAEEFEGGLLLEHKGKQILIRETLRGEQRIFCLVVSSGDRREALTEAQRQMEGFDPEQVLSREHAARQAFGVSSPDALKDPSALICVEVLAGALRAPRGPFQTRWSASNEPSPAGHEQFDINQLYGLCEAWAIVDPDIARELVRCAVGVLSSNGFLPARMDSMGNASSEAAWPLLVQCCHVIHQAAPDAAFLASVLPRLGDYLGHALEYYHQGNQGIPLWRSPEEALIPELNDSELAPVDLNVLLLRELALFQELSKGQTLAVDSPFLQSEQERIRGQFQELFWNEKLNLFTDRYVGGDPITRFSLSAYLPLLLSDLESGRADHLIRHLLGSRSLLGIHGVQLWQSWDEDEVSAPIAAPHQLLMYRLLQRSDTAECRDLFQDGIKRTLRQHLEAGSGLPGADLRLDSSEEGLPRTQTEFDPMTAALGIAVQSATGEVDISITQYPRVVRWLERHRRGVLSACVAVLALFIAGVAILYAFKNTYTAQDQLAVSGLAKSMYALGDYDKAIELYEQLLEHSREDQLQGNFYFMLGQAYYHLGDYERAGGYYEQALEKETHTPQPRWNLAVTRYHQGQLKEALELYTQVIDEFGKTLPALKKRGNFARKLIRERLGLPPMPDEAPEPPPVEDNE